MESPLPGLELAGCDGWNAWLAAERADIDKVRAAFLARASQDASFTPQHQRMFGQEAEDLGAEVQPPAPRAVELKHPPANDLIPGLGQQVRYCYAEDGVRIAHATTGEGPPLVKSANWLNHLDLDWSGPIWGRLFTDLSRGRSLVRYDERGNGLSDWDVADLSFDAFVRDLETVVDSTGIERFPLLGISQGVAVSIEYAARHPERVSHLILLGGYAAGWRHTADAAEVEQREAIITLVRHGWGGDNPAYRQIFSQTFMPSGTHEELDWFNDFQRRTVSPENAARFLEAFSHIDVRHRLRDVRCPTLVLHARGDQRIPLQQGIELAASIPGASLVTLDTDNHVPLGREPAAEKVSACIDAFLQSAPQPQALRRRQLARPR